MTVPAGTVKVLLVRRSISPGGLGALVALPDVAPLGAEAEALSRFSVVVAFSAGGFDPQPRITAKQNETAISFTRIERYPPQSVAVVSESRVRSNRVKKLGGRRRSQAGGMARVRFTPLLN